MANHDTGILLESMEAEKSESYHCLWRLQGLFWYSDVGLKESIVNTKAAVVPGTLIFRHRSVTVLVPIRD